MKKVAWLFFLAALPAMAADEVSAAKAAELALHRCERLVSLAKIPDSFLWKLRSIRLAIQPDKNYRIALDQYPGPDGKASRLDLLLDPAGKALQGTPQMATEATDAPNWPDKDPVTLAENSLHYVLDNNAVKPELKPYFNGFETLVLSAGKDADGKLIAVSDIRAKGITNILRIRIKTDGNFASAEFVAQ